MNNTTNPNWNDRYAEASQSDDEIMATFIEIGESLCPYIAWSITHGDIERLRSGEMSYEDLVSEHISDCVRIHLECDDLLGAVEIMTSVVKSNQSYKVTGYDSNS